MSRRRLRSLLSSTVLSAPDASADLAVRQMILLVERMDDKAPSKKPNAPKIGHFSAFSISLYKSVIY
jgi:hypothetical protein